MTKQYSHFITDVVSNIEEGTPILTEEVANRLMYHFYDLDKKHAKELVNANLKRLKEHGKLESYKKGIYYKTVQTVFGKMPIDSNQLVVKLYVKKEEDIVGYETGASLFHKMGLTTLMPKYKYIATNCATQKGNKIEKDLKVVIRKPNTHVTKENYRYLQVIDILENKDKIHIDVLNAFNILNEFMKSNDLDFGKLLAEASKNYRKEVIGRICKFAETTRL